MRVALAIEQLAIGGAERVVAELALALARAGHDARVYCLADPGPPARELERRGVAVRGLSSRGFDPGLVVRLVRALRGDRIDVLNCHNSASFAWCLPPARVLGIPIVLTRHGGLLGRETRYARLAERLMPAAAAITIVAANLRAALPASVRDRAIFIPNGIDRPATDRLAARRNLEVACGRALRAPVVLSVGTICPEKDTRGLLAAFAALRRTQPHAELVIIGGARASAYLAQVWRDEAELDLRGRVSWLGHVPEAWRLMAGADVFVQASRTEAMPIALLEAMSQGVPIVATAVGQVGALGHDQPDALLRHAQTALLVPPAEPAVLALALDAALRDQPAARQRAEAAVSEYSARFTAHHMATRYAEAYAQALRGNRVQTPRRPRRPRVLMVGPAAPEIGGMASVIDGLMTSPLAAHCRLSRFATGRPVAAVANPESSWWRAASAPLRHGCKLLQLAATVVGTRAQLVHIHTCSGATFFRNAADLLIARMLGARVVLHIHGGRFAEFIRTAAPARARWIQRALRAAHDVIVLSESMRRDLLASGADRPLHVVPNGVACAAPRSPGAPRCGPVRLLFLGLQSRAKGLADLLAAVERLHTERMDFELAIVGPAAAETAELRRLHAHLNPRVRWCGPVDAAGRARLFEQNDVLVHPSHSEALPVTLLEAGAAGLAVVATEVGATAEIAGATEPGDARAALWLVRPRAPAELAAALRRVISEPDLRVSLARRLQKRVYSRFSLERSATLVLAVYGAERDNHDSIGLGGSAITNASQSATAYEPIHTLGERGADTASRGALSLVCNHEYR